MATKLSSITSSYRSFTDDQVLTADQLNTLVNYFQDQQRLTRVCLNGVGIVCGLKVSIGSGNEITVTQGCGVTTDGDLIRLLKPIPESAEMTMDLEQIRFTHYKVYEDEIVKYAPFFKNQAQLTIYELVPDFQNPKTDSFPLSQLAGADKMVALFYLEEYPKTPELCTSIDCNNQGIEEVSKLKLLLVSEDDAEAICSTDPIYTNHHILQAYHQLPELAVERVLLTPNSAASQSNLLKSFHSAIASNNTVAGLKTAFTILLNSFAGFLKLPANVTSAQVNTQIDNLLGFSALNIPVDVQYRYDLLKDLVDTYAEIKSILLDLDAECCPSVLSFPKHLLLGKLDEPANFRHSFYKSPVSGNESQNIRKFSSLVYRFFLMLSQYKPSGDEARITPSNAKAALSGRSIPFYYAVNQDLINNWDFEKTRRLAQKTNLAYDKSQLSSAPHIQNPLKFNLDAFDFFRIEGQLGKSTVTAEPQISQKISSLGLDFDYASFDLDANQNDLQSYISKNSSLEHLAGVHKSGTFVVLKKANLIVADFALAYKYRAEQGESCCKISECSYPWISSLKYLNNLSRSLKGTQSRKLLMPKAYRLFITQYAINGVSLITQPVEIAVPLADVFNGRLHSVTRKLNERFPTGLVFDFDQESKLLKIKKLKEDTFVFSLRDITQSNTSPIYTFTEKSMLKNGRILQSKTIVCTDVNLHQKSFYEQLHAKFDPKNKDDDYGKYDELWKRWAELMEHLKHHKLFREIAAKRFPLKVADLPKEVQAELRQIRADIAQTVPNSKVWLSGEWTSGSWVNQNMVTYYNANKKNTHDDLVLFMQLRERLHQRTGKSKYTLFVDPVTDLQIKVLQAKYLNKVDFYVGKVGGIMIEV
jgi:hypothetical protein